MAILTETYSAKAVLDKVNITRQQWAKEDSILGQESRDTNNQLKRVDRMHKVNGVIQTNKEYLDLYAKMQELNEQRSVIKNKVRDADSIIRRLEDIKGDRKFKGEFEEMTVELTIKQRIMYGFEEGSDLHGL